MEERKIIRITQEMRDALYNVDDWCESAIGRITEVLEETLNTLGKLMEYEEDDEELDREDELLHTLAELYIGLRVNNADSIQERIIKNVAEDILGDPQETKKGTAIRHAAVGMAYVMIALKAREEENRDPQ